MRVAAQSPKPRPADFTPPAWTPKTSSIANLFSLSIAGLRELLQECNAPAENDSIALIKAAAAGAAFVEALGDLKPEQKTLLLKKLGLA